MNSNKDPKVKTPPVSANKERKRDYPRRRKEKRVTNKVKEDGDEEYFTGSTIMNNFGVCSVLMELANILTSNSALPEEQLGQLKFSLTKKLAAVFASLLNTFMSKVSGKVIKDVQNSTLKTVDAGCQTDITGSVIPS